MVQIAVIGDVHTLFNQDDVRYFNESAYDLLLFVGDLANYRHREGVDTARVLAGLKKPALFIPGNHDAITTWQLLAEIRQRPFWIQWFGRGHARRVAQLRQALGPVVMGGYSSHAYAAAGVPFDIVAARPFAMGGSMLSYAPYLRAAFAVPDMAASTARLRNCVEATRSNTLIFLAHNGPTGLGGRSDDIWGRDFNPVGGDFGDSDLADAVAYARAIGKRVVAVVAGHMHRRTRQGTTRAWLVEYDGVFYVNAARVPRIFVQGGHSHHHHVQLCFDAREATAADVVWTGSLAV